MAILGVLIQQAVRLRGRLPIPRFSPAEYQEIELRHLLL